MRVIVLHTQPLPDRPSEPPTVWEVDEYARIIGPPTEDPSEPNPLVLGFTPSPATNPIGDRVVLFDEFWTHPTKVLGMQALVETDAGLAACPEIVTGVFESVATRPGGASA